MKDVTITYNCGQVNNTEGKMIKCHQEIVIIIDKR